MMGNERKTWQLLSNVFVSVVAISYIITIGNAAVNGNFNCGNITHYESCNQYICASVDEAGSVFCDDADCQSNCYAVVEPSLRVTIRALVNNTVLGIATPFTYRWTLQIKKENAPDYEDLPNWESSLINSDHTSCAITIKEDFLDRNRDYRVICEVTTPVLDQDLTRQVDLYLRGNQAPDQGTCLISPASGIANKTIFQIQCSDWSAMEDVDQSLYYSYYTILGSGDAIESLLYHGSNGSSGDLVLPVGDRDNGYMLRVWAYIFDSSIGYTIVNLKVQTTPPKLDRLLGTNPALRLSEILSRDTDPSQIMRKLMTISTVLIKANKLMRTAMAQTLADLINNLQRSDGSILVGVEHTETWLQALGTLSLIANKPDELTGRTQLLLVETLENVTANVIRVSLFMSRQQYNNVARDIVSIVSSLQQAAVYGKTGAENISAVKLAVTREVVTRCDRVERDISTSVLRRLYSGDSLLRLQAAGLTVSLWKDPLFSRRYNKVLHASRTGLSVDGFTLPATLTDDILDPRSGSRSPISLRTRHYQFNPYVWGDDLGYRVTSAVQTLDLLDEEYQQIEVRDTKDPIDIIFHQGRESTGPDPPDNPDDVKATEEPYRPANETYQNALLVQFSSGNNKFCYMLHISQEEFSEELKGNVSSGLYMALSDAIRSAYGTQDSDDKDPCAPAVTEISLDKDTVNNSLRDFRNSLNETHGILTVETDCEFTEGWDTSTSKILNSEQGINLTFQFHFQSCVYWHEASETWRQHGCRVSPLSTGSATVCQCNHLTNFASIVRPVNKIDFIYVFTKTNLGENAAVFAVVLGILGLAILLAPVMRWKDRQDMIKWAAHPLADNSSDDTYLYMLSVYTGYAKNSGTRSVVYLDLVGESGETRDRRLQGIGDSVKLDTGTLNRYLMGVPRCLGPLVTMRVRHDNSGEGHSASWYMYWVVVCDLQNKFRYCFVLNDWLAADSNTNKVPSRSLPLAGREETLAVQSDFYRIVQERLADNHLWNSLFHRPLSSRFSRVQRLGVCVSLLFLFLITNAMFYSLDSPEGKPVCSPFRVTIGPYTITSQQLYIGTITSLIVFPYNFVIIQIFRHARRPLKTPTLGGKLMDFATRYEQTPSRVHRGHLPHWCVYVAWFMVLLSVITSGFFVVLYSLQWGKRQSESWLVSVFTSLIESVLLVEPVKVVFVAFLLSCCCGKFLRRFMFKNPDNIIEHDGNTKEDTKTAQPDQASLNTMWWQGNINAEDIVQQIGRHLVFISLIIAIIILYRDSDAYYMTKAVNDAFLSPKPYFKKIRTFQNYWDWTDTVLFPTLYGGELYNGEAPTEAQTKFVGMAIGFRVGSVRLRQLRVRPETCVVSKRMTEYGFTSECNDAYSISNDDTSYYGESWQSGLIPEWVCNGQDCPWRYTPSPNPITGKFKGVRGTVYGGGGFIADLGTTAEQGYRAIRYLRDTRWIDVQTRAVFIEFTLYNPDANYFTLVTYVLEFPPSNAGVPSSYVHTFRLYDVTDKTQLYSLMITLLHAVFLLWLVHLAFVEFEHIKKARVRYFMSFANCLEAVGILLSLIQVFVYAVRKFAVDATSVKIRSNDDLHFTFRTVVFVDELYALMLGLIAFIATVKLQAIICFDRRFTVLTRTLSDAKFKLFNCAIIFFIVFYAFVWINHLVIGTQQEGYSTIIATSETLLITLLGKFRFSQFDAGSSKTLTIITFVLFCIVQGFILLNMLMSIIIDSYATVRNEEATYHNKVYLEDVVRSEFTRYVGKITRYIRKILPPRVIKRWDDKRVSAGKPSGDQRTVASAKTIRQLPRPSSSGRKAKSSPHDALSGDATGKRSSTRKTKEELHTKMAPKHPQGITPNPGRLAQCLQQFRRTDATMNRLEETVDQLVRRLGITVQKKQIPDHMDLETI